MYDNGIGVPQDTQQAVFWWNKAAEQGDVEAQNNLGVMYDMGLGVPQDYIEAHKWFNIAGAGGKWFKVAGEWVNNIAGMGDDADIGSGLGIVESFMTPAEIAEAQRRASEWMKKHKK